MLEKIALVLLQINALNKNEALIKIERSEKVEHMIVHNGVQMYGPSQWRTGCYILMHEKGATQKKCGMKIVQYEKSVIWK